MITVIIIDEIFYAQIRGRDQEQIEMTPPADFALQARKRNRLI